MAVKEPTLEDIIVQEGVRDSDTQKVIEDFQKNPGINIVKRFADIEGTSDIFKKIELQAYEQLDDIDKEGLAKRAIRQSQSALSEAVQGRDASGKLGINYQRAVYLFGRSGNTNEELDLVAEMLSHVQVPENYSGKSPVITAHRNLIAAKSGMTNPIEGFNKFISKYRGTVVGAATHLLVARNPEIYNLFRNGANAGEAKAELVKTMKDVNGVREYLMEFYKNTDEHSRNAIAYHIGRTLTQIHEQSK